METEIVEENGRGFTMNIARDKKELDFPVQGWIHKTKKGGLVLRALVCCDKDPIIVSAQITGRRVVQENISFRLTPDGEKEDLIQDEDVCSMMED